MAKLILRSGYLENFNALGVGGQTIFETTIQIRETIRLRKQQIILDCLAIPQYNDSEDKVDWYAPFQGVVTPWAYASEQQREQAVGYLENCLAVASAISHRCLAAEKTSVNLFGAMLVRLFQFPGSQYIYLVDDKPVITFWGFLNLNQSPREDVFDCLRPVKTPEVNELATSTTEVVISVDREVFIDPEVDIVKMSQPDLPLLNPVFGSSPEQPPIEQQEPPQTITIPETEPNTPRPAKKHRWVKIISVALMFIILQLAWSYLTPYFSSLFDSTPSAATAAPQHVAEAMRDVLPLQAATVISPSAIAEEKPAQQVTTDPVEVAVNRKALVLPHDEVKIGSSLFMDGKWKATFGTSKSPTIRFNVKNNKGSALINKGNNIICKTDIYLGLMQSGNLQIKSHSKAICTDESRYRIPEITCKQGLTGAAMCTGYSDDESAVPMTILRVSK